MSGVTTGIVEAIDVAAQTIQVGRGIFQVGPLTLTQLHVGQRVTVTWDAAGDRREARTVVIEQP
jgi:hypothetical protein